MDSARLNLELKRHERKRHLMRYGDFKFNRSEEEEGSGSGGEEAADANKSKVRGNLIARGGGSGFSEKSKAIERPTYTLNIK